MSIDPSDQLLHASVALIRIYFLKSLYDVNALVSCNSARVVMLLSLFSGDDDDDDDETSVMLMRN